MFTRKPRERNVSDLNNRTARNAQALYLLSRFDFEANNCVYNRFYRTAKIASVLGRRRSA
jgi:hypothetical protein